MEVKGKNAGDPQAARHRVVEAQRDYYATQRSQAATAGSEAANPAAAGDRVQLSDSTSNAMKAERAHEEVRAARVAELRAELEIEGTLNTPERVAHAAARILEG